MPMTMPLMTAPEPVSGGLLALGGIAEGLKSGLLAYHQRKEAEEAKRQKNAMLSIQAQKQGLLYDPNTGNVSRGPEWQRMQALKQLPNKINFIKSAPQDWVMGTTEGQNSLKGVYDELNGIPSLSDEEESDDGVIDREPQGLIDRGPAGAFTPIPGYKPKKERDIEDAIKKAVGIERGKQSVGKILPATQAEKFGDAKSTYDQLDSLEETINANKDSFGPIKGLISGHNPYDTKAMVLNAQLWGSLQKIGTYLEGGVLREGDVEKYKKIMPKLGEEPEVSLGKIQLLRKLVADKEREGAGALGDAGYKTKNIKTRKENLPGILLPQEGGLSDEEERRYQELLKKQGGRR